MAESTIADDLLQREGEDVCNAKTICCKLCPSTILLPGKGKLVKKPINLPHTSVKAKTAGTTEAQTDSLTDFWLVIDMFTFENVGFSNAVGEMKYLICADCEQGPIGWCLDADRKHLYVAHDRVSYK